jgi:hypothetical protein
MHLLPGMSELPSWSWEVIKTTIIKIVKRMRHIKQRLNARKLPPFRGD